MIPVETQQERAASEYRDYLLGQGEDIGQIFNEYLSDSEEGDDSAESEAELGTLLCVIDTKRPRC